MFDILIIFIFGYTLTLINMTILPRKTLWYHIKFFLRFVKMWNLLMSTRTNVYVIENT